MAAGHIRKRKTKKGTSWQIVLEHGTDDKGYREREYKTVNGTKRDAERLLTKLLSDLESGQYVKEIKITVAQYLRDWLRTYVEANLSPTTIDGYRTNIEKHIIPYIGNIQLQQLKPMDVQNLYLKLSRDGRTDGKGGLSAKSVRYVHRNLRKALDQACRMEMVSKNIADMVTLPKPKSYEATVYDQDELIALLKKVKGTDLEVPIAITVTTGLRRGELLGLRWADINMENKKMVIRNNLIHSSQGLILNPPKTDKGNRVIDLPDTLVELLKRHRKIQLENRLKLGEQYQDNGLVCCSNDGAFINPKYFSHKFSRFLIKHGLKKIRFHDLRHSNATLMLQYGIPAKVASQRLGHSSIGITLDIYSHVIGDMQKEVTDRIDTSLLSRVYQSS